MCSQIFDDSDAILSGNEHWSKLDEEWGTPVDLETEDDFFVPPANLQSFYSTADLRRPRPTFDSAFMLKKRRKLCDSLSKKSQVSRLDYSDFVQELDQKGYKDQSMDDLPEKQFYYIGGQIISAISADEICEKIDNMFQSVEKLCASTSTIRTRKRARPVPKMPPVPQIIECSISTGDLSFDDTVANLSEKEKSDGDDVERFIDELFDNLNNTAASLHKSRVLESSGDQMLDQSSMVSVTSLVKKFSSIMQSPVVKCSPRRQRQCCDRFRDLAEFWKTKALFEETL